MWERERPSEFCRRAGRVHGTGAARSHRAREPHRAQTLDRQRVVRARDSCRYCEPLTGTAREFDAHGRAPRSCGRPRSPAPKSLASRGSSGWRERACRSTGQHHVALNFRPPWNEPLPGPCCSSASSSRRPYSWGSLRSPPNGSSETTCAGDARSRRGESDVHCSILFCDAVLVCWPSSARGQRATGLRGSRLARSGRRVGPGRPRTRSGRGRRTRSARCATRWTAGSARYWVCSGCLRV